MSTHGQSRSRHLSQAPLKTGVRLTPCELGCQAGIALCVHIHRYRDIITPLPTLVLPAAFTRHGLDRADQARLGSPPARAQQRLVQDVRPVSACQHHNSRSGGEAVHLHQQLVQSVLALIIAPGKPSAAPGPTDGINLICTGTRSWGSLSCLIYLCKGPTEDPSRATSSIGPCMRQP